MFLSSFRVATLSPENDQRSESLIDNVLSVSGTDYQDIGALGRTKSSKNIAQTLTPCQPFGMVGSLDGRTGKKSCSRAENDEIL